MNEVKLFAGIFGVILLVILLVEGVRYMTVPIEGHVEAQENSASHYAYKHSTTYTEGINNQIANFYGQWALSNDPVTKSTLVTLARHAATTLDPSEISPAAQQDLQLMGVH